MEKSNYKIYGYRWVILIIFALLNAVIQMVWITFAPVTVDAMRLYHTSAFWIVLLSMSFMLVYLIFSMPASYIIDKYGIRVGVGIGALLMAVFGYLRGVYGTDYAMICISQFALAVAQPFIMNAITKVAAEWFPINERATASGITALAQIVGVIAALALTKPIAQAFLPESANGHLDLNSMQSMLKVYGYICIGVTVLFLIFVKEKPPTPPCLDKDSSRISVREGRKYIFRNKDMLLLLMIFFIGMGMFNAITTFVDLISASKGYLADANESGLIGAIMMGAGILGAAIVPVISDRTRKRKFFLVLCLSGMVPGLIGFTFFRSMVPLLISSGIFGFFFMAAAPIGYQYAAELSHPAPESTSLGFINLVGQFSGIIFITLMAVFGNVSMAAFADATKAANTITLTPFMIGFIVLAVLNVILSIRIKESTMVKGH